MGVVGRQVSVQRSSRTCAIVVVADMGVVVGMVMVVDMVIVVDVVVRNVVVWPWIKSTLWAGQALHPKYKCIL